MTEVKLNRITFHGLCYTCATLAGLGVPVKFVSQRLDHKRVEIRLTSTRTCSHDAKDPAAKLSRLFYGEANRFNSKE
jgi:integrase